MFFHVRWSQWSILSNHIQTNIVSTKKNKFQKVLKLQEFKAIILVFQIPQFPQIPKYSYCFFYNLLIISPAVTGANQFFQSCSKSEMSFSWNLYWNVTNEIQLNLKTRVGLTFLSEYLIATILFRCASISCTDDRIWLTHSLTDRNWNCILHVWQFSHQERKWECKHRYLVSRGSLVMIQLKTDLLPSYLVEIV